MNIQKEKKLKYISKGVKEMNLMEAGKLKGQDLGEMMQELKAGRDKQGGAGRGQGRKSKGYTTRIWVTNEEKKLITDRRAAENKILNH